MNPQKAIIDTTTRVIKRLSIDTNPTLDVNETAVTLSSPITLNGFQVLGLDNKTLTPATQTQIDVSRADDTRNAFLYQQKVAIYKAALVAAIADPRTPISLKAFLIALQNIL